MGPKVTHMNLEQQLQKLHSLEYAMAKTATNQDSKFGSIQFLKICMGFDSISIEFGYLCCLLLEKPKCHAN